MKMLIFSLLCLPVFIQAQDLSWNITFAGTNASSTVDSVMVENLTQQTSISLGGNDLLILDVTLAISEPGHLISNALHIFPNPANGACTFQLPSSFSSKSSLEVFDISGKLIFRSEEILEPGMNYFTLDGLTGGVFVIKIKTAQTVYSGKIISMNSTGNPHGLSLTRSGSSASSGGSGVHPESMKTTAAEFIMPYTAGDLLKFRGKAGLHKAVVMLVPTGDREITFNFIPCVDADGRHYATVRIGSQYWMAENLDVGVMINGSQAQTDNGIIEKYFYDNDETNGETYGSLYQWGELMQYGNEGARGLCPDGFHIPTRDEYNSMIYYLGGSTQAGGKLKERGYEHWNYPNTSATDKSGFEALPNGASKGDGIFDGLKSFAKIWASSPVEPSNAWLAFLSDQSGAIGLYAYEGPEGYSCRCIQDNAEEMTMLAGDTAKTWKLIRDVTTARYPMEVGPYDHSTIWWAMGLNNDELGNRHCMLNDEWTFGRDGSLVFNAYGDYWAEGGIFDPANFCESTDYMININGEDCSGWGNGNHQFALVTGDNPRLTTLGHGAYLGFYKTATDYEVIQLDPMVQDSVRYNLVMLSDGETDTLIVEVPYYFYPGDLQYGGYWRYVLVHYDNPADEPPLPGPVPTADFTAVSDGLTVTCTNLSLYGEDYLWDFGDGTTDTAFNAVHTYAYDSVFHITLTVTNPNGSDMTSQDVWISVYPLTEEMLQGGPWSVRVQEYSIFVGSGMGLNDWWAVPLANLDGSMIGTTEDWSCITDDEFTFGAGGSYTYQAFGDVRNDGYFGSPNGCWAESALYGNALYFASGSHTYAFTPANGTERPIITLTNGANRAAFIGFYKGFYGGENYSIENPPNGGFPTNTYEVMGYCIGEGTDYLFISVDISSDHSGTAAWSVILQRD